MWLMLELLMDSVCGRVQIDMHIHAGVIHYGISVFEGLKAFHCAGRSRDIYTLWTMYDALTVVIQMENTG